MEEWDYAFDPENNAWLMQERGIRDHGTDRKRQTHSGS
jgi:hypothetical protein